MNKASSSWAKFAGEWFLPPKFFNALIAHRTKRAHKREKADPRRFWNGEPLASPLANVPIFTKAALSAQTITLGRESRDCIELPIGTKTVLQTQQTSKIRFRIGIGFQGKSKLGEAVTVFLNQKPVARLECLVANQWHDVRIEMPLGTSTLSFEHNCEGTLFLSHPAAETISSAQTSAQPKNVIVLLLDSLIPECISLYGNTASTTPYIDKMFEDGLICENAFSQSEWTYPSVHSMFTGFYPTGHDSNDPDSPGGGMPTDQGSSLAEQMRALGYSTFCYSSAKGFSPGYNAHVGFDRFFNSPYWTHGPSFLQITDQAITQLEANRDGKNFLFLHFLETHAPWLTRTELGDLGLSNFRITEPQAHYDSLQKGVGETKGEPMFDDDGIQELNQRRISRMREIDLTIARLFHYLEHSGKMKDTIVLLTSDHGYAYPQQKQPLLCKSRVNVPLLLRGPGIPKLRYKGFVANNVDMLPTILKLAGRDANKTDGEVLAPLSQAAEREYVLSESLYRNRYQVAIRDKNYVYHFRCKFDNLQVKIFPKQQTVSKLFATSEEHLCKDLSNERSAECEKMHRILENHFRRHPNRIET